ncbi:MAG: DUF2267 domain-containing protein [Phycisphaeraceae bacterium]
MATSMQHLFDATWQKSHQWLKELEEIGQFQSEEQAYSACRAVLHALRDRLTVGEAAHLASELPMLIRGFYYEGWKPSGSPVTVRDRDTFIKSVRDQLRNNVAFDPEDAVRAVFTLLERKVSEGEIQDVKQVLPEPIRTLWPEH